MKRKTWLVSLAGIALLLIVSTCLAIVVFRPLHRTISADELIIKKDLGSVVALPEDEVIRFFEANRPDFKAIAGYMLANEMLFNTRPFGIGKGRVDQIAMLQDTTMQAIAIRLLDEGILQGIWSLNDDPVQNVHFIVGSESGGYEQGIRYVSDPQIIEQDQAGMPVSYICINRSLGEGWYYYVSYYADIKDADGYRKAAWDRMGESGQAFVTQDWTDALVTLYKWSAVSGRTARLDGTQDKPCDFVVAVTFRTMDDGILGPMVSFYNPDIKAWIGVRSRE